MLISKKKPSTDMDSILSQFLLKSLNEISSYVSDWSLANECYKLSNFLVTKMKTHIVFFSDLSISCTF